MSDSTIARLYVVRAADGSYFAGYDTVKQKSMFVEDPKEGKRFSNKGEVKLRPDEMLVELSVDLATADVTISEPFRPHRKVPR